MDPLMDNEFLKELFSYKHRETYARITSLNIDEEPLQRIEGRVTQGTVNLDGNSSMRRSSNLSMITTDETEINDYYWSVNTKYKLEIGLKNVINLNYPDIIWFKMGIYVITSFSMSYTTAGSTISISGKDKMCLINGDVSGAIYASVDFGTREEVDVTTGEKTLVDIEIEDIIREAIHEYAHQPWEKIIIKDLPKYGLFLLEWLGETPLQVLIPTTGRDEGTQVITDEETVVYTAEDVSTTISQLEHYLTTNELTIEDKSLYTQISLSNTYENTYYVCRILSNQAAGYDVTNLTYPHENEESGLIASIGDSVASVMDKIVEFLGDYEYFYDLDGNFVFQMKNKGMDKSWNVNDFNTSGRGNDYDLTAMYDNNWCFEGSEMITGFNNSPNLGNIKNDYAIWGERTSGDNTIPIHMRYAVDKKPQYYKSIYASAEELEAYKKLYPEFENGFRNVDDEGNWPSVIYYTEDFDTSLLPVGIEAHEVDWREVIYQMALDYRRFNHFDTFNIRILQNNILSNGDVLYPKGITGYEQYYVDLEGFWRYLYRPDYDDSYTLQYSLKTMEELDLSKVVYVKDIYCSNLQKFQNTTESLNFTPTQVDKYIVFKQNIGGIDTPCFIPEDLANKINIREYLKQNVLNNIAKDTSYMWEYTENKSKVFKEFIYRSLNVLNNYNIYQDNGSTNEFSYDDKGYIIDVTEGNLKSEKFNLLTYIDDTMSLDRLQVMEGQEVTDFLDDNQLEKFNPYIVYKISDKEYYMMQIEKEIEDLTPHYVFKLVRVKTPTYDGIKQYDFDEQVYVTSYSEIDNLGYCYNYSTKIGALETLPSTFKYENFYYKPIKLGENKLFYLPDSVESLNSVKLKQIQNNREIAGLTDTIYHFVYTGYEDIEEFDDGIKLIFRYDEDSYYKYINYLNTDTRFIPILNENQDFTFKHEPIAQYQEYYEYSYDESYNLWWNKLIEESPELLIFWFDFLDSQTSAIGKYGVNNVMDRSKAENDNKVKAIYYRDTLNIVYQRLNKTDLNYEILLHYLGSGYNIIQAGAWVWDQFRVSNCGKSCKDVLDQWLQAYTQANESVNFNCIPIYTLEPNNRISIQNDNTKINGEYVINSINIPLTFNGTMSVNATKAVSKL